MVGGEYLEKNRDATLADVNDPSTPYKSWMRAARSGGWFSAYWSLAWRPVGNSYRAGAY